MASSFPQAMTGVLFPALEGCKVDHRAVYQQHCHRIYSLAFWVTDNEIAAEQLAANTFLRVFSRKEDPGHDEVDAGFLAEVGRLTPLGRLTLHNRVAAVVPGLRGNIKRVHLEQAVLKLPVTEKLIFLLHDVEGYSHEKLGGLLGLTEDECRFAVHQARLFVRELVLQMS